MERPKIKVTIRRRTTPPPTQPPIQPPTQPSTQLQPQKIKLTVRPRAALPYAGQRGCEFLTSKAKACANRAYFQHQGKLGCGVHLTVPDRIVLPRMSASQREESLRLLEEQERVAIDQATQLHASQGRRGQVVLSRMLMMKEPTHRPGFLNVYPNYRDQHRRRGFGCASLSPKSMGPIEHHQPGLPASKNLENFHQGSKCFREEAIPDDRGGYRPGPLYYQNRLSYYEDPVPHRHKYTGQDARNKNIPLFFVWVDQEGREHHLSYVESRQFYCTYYERIASQDPNYLRLRQLLEQGTDLQICGYDAFPLGSSAAEIEQGYLDPSHPFGHERVLYAMLLLEPEQYPWRRHATYI